MAEDEWEEQKGADLWLPEKENEELVGEVTDIQEGAYGNQFVIKQKDGEEIRTPSHKVLQNRMIKAEVGTQVKIVYDGEEPPSVKGNNPTKMYTVSFKKA